MQGINPSQITPEYVMELVGSAITKAKEYLDEGKIIDAEALLKQAHRCASGNVEVLRLLGQVFIKRSKPQEAIDCYKRSLEIDPDDFESLNNIALCYNVLGEYDAAIERLDRAIEVFPKEASTRWNLAIVYKDKGEMPKALETFEKAVSEITDSAELHYHHGVALGEAHEYDKARIAYTKALDLDPSNALARWNRSLILLSLCRYPEGFIEYECRWKAVEGYGSMLQRFKDKPQWHPDHKPETVFVWNEQGIGDAFQFVRYLPKLKELGHKVILEVQPSMVELLSQCDGVDEVIPLRKKGVEYDSHVSINSLPYLLGETHDTVLNKVPYIKPTGTIKDEHFGYTNDFKIGICWAGSPVHRRDKERSMALKLFEPIHNIPMVKLFSLQKDLAKRFQPGMGVVDLTEGADNMSIVNMSDLLLDWNYTAAIIDQMDFVVTVDTAVAHLAGAMGKQVCLLLSENPDWRWSVFPTEETVWYPTMKLYRKWNSWEEVIDKVAEDIGKHVKGCEAKTGHLASIVG